ncbi:MAG: galactose-1-epimerase, partial [Candidatus Aminicenantes bacterium]|nr:galactose-1-epimerase [Candidatus Aminicenantes bacterium]
AYSLSIYPDKKLEKYMDKLIEKIAAAQEDDGYLYTARTIDPKNPPKGAGEKRWSNLGSSHELYNVGHMYEAAVAYYLATGKKNFLDIAIKNADFIADTFGPDKRRGFPGHQEIEIGLVKLFKLTNKKKYLKLAQFFLEERGKKIKSKKFSKDSEFSIYNQKSYLQDHKPVIEQRTAIGHAVRATYMYSGMADVATLTNNRKYINAIDRIWEDVVLKKLYLTGGIGSIHRGEAFGKAYELPNKTAYNETCAAIGNVFWNYRLFLLHGDAKYIDVLERTLYNGLISGVSLSGDLFFYPNPLESDGKYKFNQGELTRKPWFSCACCPVNISRFIPSLTGYIYATQGANLYINLFVNNKGKIKIKDFGLQITQNTNYPWDGKIKLKIVPQKPTKFNILIRIPGWSTGNPVPGDLYTFLKPLKERPVIKLNSKKLKLRIIKGYMSINRIWERGDTVELYLPMPVKRVISHKMVKENLNKAALERGPIVYCFEGVDNDGKVINKKLPDDMEFSVKFDPKLSGGIKVITGKDENGNTLTAVPYYSWSHRGAGEMAVWLLRKGSDHNKSGENTMRVTRSLFGRTGDGKEVYIYTLENNNNIRVRITELGGIITSIKLPDKNNTIRDIVLGFNNLKQYLSGHPYFGAIIGRYANRIGKGKFILDGKEYSLAKNNGNNHLHGGLKGFDKVIWSSKKIKSKEGAGVVFNYISRDGEEGYPGNLSITVAYTLNDYNELKIHYEAETDKPTPVNLTNHSYFNLKGEGNGDVLDHMLKINGSEYTPVDEGLIPTGELLEVKGTPMDFLKPHPIGERIKSVRGGYDHNYVLNKDENKLSLAARVTAPETGITMEISTSEPGIQFYSGNFLDNSLNGKSGKKYKKHFGFCLESQHYPDSPNKPNFPSVILRPGEKYFQTTIYKFYLKR